MKNSTTKNITEILQNSGLSHIVQRVGELHELNRKIQQLLPEQYRRLYRIVNLSDNSLIFEVQNATIRQGLSLQKQYLLKCIQTDFPHITELQFNINPDFKYV
ncbi:DciA family protein [Glaesserella sp.]|uniref:DciA family protein n=1 Tax=Glaesserella sp. TaxID=2094731 RepID=UPI0035A18162